MLKYVKIDGFKSIRNLELHLDSGIASLVGRNGAGKSNILLTISWLAEKFTAPETVVLPEGATMDGEGTAFEFGIQLNGHEYVYSVSLEAAAGHSNEVSQLRERLTVATPDTSEELFRRAASSVTPSGYTTLETQELVPAMAALSAMLPEGHPLLKHIRAVAGFLKTVRYYALDMVFRPDDRARDFVGAAAYDKWRNAFKKSSIPPPSVAYRIVYMFEEDKAAFNELTNILGPNGLDLVSGIEVFSIPAPPTETQKPDEVSPHRAGYLIFFVPTANAAGAGNLFPFSYLSAGTQRVIRMLVSMMFDRSAVMMIEQPEDCLHAGLTHKLIELFRAQSGDSQVLLTTHSADVLNSLRAEEIRFVWAESGNTHLRALTEAERKALRGFLESEGTVAEFLASIEQE